jgi:Raf kinase inhibitor-like YbhB/YbcL family protein
MTTTIPRHVLLFLAIVLALLLLSGSRARSQNALTLESPVFAAGATIPRLYTCAGDDKSPPLSWSGIPSAARTIALIVDDPDAPRGTWTHWVLYDVSGKVTHLDEGVAKSPTLPDGARQGVNSFGRIGYNGPCPPRGAPHHYHFRLFALDSALDLEPGATAAQVEAATHGHVLASTELIGIFGR